MANPLSGVLLGFDFGLRHIGVAVGQTITQTANPLTTLKAEQGCPNWVEITALIKTWQPTALVVGIPVNMDGTALSVTKPAKRFARQLHVETQLPVYLADERLTTVAAKAALFEEGGYSALKKDQIDQLSAKLILESFMNAPDLCDVIR